MKPFSNGIRAYEWMYGPLKVVTLENERLRISLLPNKGSDVVEIRYKPKDINVLLTLPLNFPLTSLVPSSRGAFFDYYEGGWQDILPTAGEANFKFRGIEWGVSGESSLIPWEYDIVTSNDEVCVKLSTELIRYPFRIEKLIRLKSGESSLEIDEKVTNLSDGDLEYMWLQHLMFGEPFISSDCKIEIPAKTLITHGPPDFSEMSFLKPGMLCEWPYGVTKEGKSIDLSTLQIQKRKVYDIAYVTDLEAGRFSITSPRYGLTFEMHFPNEIFRYLWLVYVFGGPLEYPWYGRVWSFGIMPCTSYPACGLLRTIENETARILRGSNSIEVRFTITLREVTDV